METISIDIETFSDVNLAECGVYKYAQSPDFEILLFGYSVDGGTIHVVDLANGEKIPDKILKALSDDSVIKWAFNANFERICLSEYLNRYYPEYFRSYSINEDTVNDYLDPASWRCTMIWSAYLGLPLSLKGVGAVLKLDAQKMNEGKELIKYFCVPCVPTKSNGGRLRNYPHHCPEKWELFKKYNKRDVEVELAIKKKLTRFPVPEFVWEEYHLDQQINDRGIAVDMKLVSQAVRLDEKCRTESLERAGELTGLDNPNSPIQLLEWLNTQGVHAESLDKKTVQELLKTATGKVREVLLLRQQLSKSSVKKYTAMNNVACDDSRARGCFQFYGANRTGRFCLTGDHEVLTDNGWCRLDEWSGGKIACWNPHGAAVSFQEANALSFPYSGDMYEYSDKRISQVSTPDHKMYVKRRYDEPWMVDTVENMAKYRPSIPFTGYRQTVAGMEHNKLRVLVMVQADGHYSQDGDIKLGFTKLRKVERCKKLLRAADIQFTYRIYENNPKPRHQFIILSRDTPLWLRLFRDKTFGTWLFDESADVFFDELVYWDGYQSAKNSIQYVTCNKQNADIVQAFAHMNGRAAQMRMKTRRDEHPNWNDAYYLDIWLTPKNCHEIRNKPVVTHFDGTVYCAETKTGFFLVRRNGKVWVTGNSGRNIQLQNLPQNHIPDLEQARNLVKSGNYDALDMLYENIPDTLSQLIRTAFVPRKNMKFIVADFSAIEARVIAWLAGERWRMEAFADGKDIYCASASQMFHVPVEKHGVNGHLRQKGKIAELACIAEGQLVLTDYGLIPIEKVTKNHRLWDGENWVTHDGVIYKGEREVLTYEGLTATPDHLVWIKGQPKPVQFGVAAASGSHLIQTGDGRKAIRLGKNYQSGETLGQSKEKLLCTNRVPRLRQCTMGKIKRLTIWAFKGMPKVFYAKANSKMAGTPINESKTTLRKSKLYGIQGLWRTRYQIRFSVRDSGRAVDNRKSWLTRQKFRNRPDRQQRKLCSWKYSFCNEKRELWKPKKYGINSIRTAILAFLTETGHRKAIGRTDERTDYSGCREGSSAAQGKLALDKCTARLYDIRNAGQHHRFTVSGKLVHNYGYGGASGAMKAMGADAMGLSDNELKQIVADWREASPNIVKLWWDVDHAVKECIRLRLPTETHGLKFSYESGFLFIELPSGRRLAYVKPRIEPNQFGGESVTYEGVGTTKKWERLESYGPKFVENCVQSIARDLLCHSMKTLSSCFIVATVHDEIIIEADKRMSLETVCKQMSRTPPWADGLLLRADGYECEFYRKD